MKKFVVHKVCSLKGQVYLPGDKSISHRAIILGSIAEGVTHIQHFLESEDCLRTIEAFRAMDVRIDKTESGQFIVYGRGLHGLKPPARAIYLGNSGTSMRLLLGLLSGQKFTCRLTGDESLSNRPMKRVVDPLGLMGARITGRRGGNYAPLTIRPGQLSGITYKLPIPSAQVKSAILLAGLYACSPTVIEEPVPSRDHTERMLKYYGADLRKEKQKIILNPGSALKGKDIDVPGDISSASFFLVAASIVPYASVLLKNVGLNSTRAGIIEVLKRMGARIEIRNRLRTCGEPRADILVRSSQLKGIRIRGKIIPRLIDELPVIMVAATAAEGITEIKDAAELRVKETDRISSMVRNLRRLGACLQERPDGVVIQGGINLRGARVKSFSDHRTAMSMAVAGLIAEGKTIIEDTECVDTSFPGFYNLLKSLIR